MKKEKNLGKSLTSIWIALIMIASVLMIASPIQATSGTPLVGLYAGGSNPGVVYWYSGGISWDVISPELGYAVLDLVEYEGYLYASTMSTSSPSSGIGCVYRYDGGTTWTLVGNNMDDQVCALAVYQGDLYAGTAWNGMKLYRYDGGTIWTQVISPVIWSGTRALHVSHDYLLMGEMGYDRFAHIDATEAFTVDLDQSYGSCIYDYEDYGGYVYGSAYTGRLWQSPDATTWSEVLGYYDGTMWELEAFQGQLYMSYNNGELRASDGTTRGSILYTAPDGIISMETDGVNLFFGTGGEAGALYYSETIGIASVYNYDGTTVTLISGYDEMVTGVQVLYYVEGIEVVIDIKPGSCPNSLNRKSKGVLPVAICGTDEFDVTTIDPSTIQLTRDGVEGYVELLRWSYEDVATPYEGEECDCHDLNGDGYMDLSLKFSTQEVVGNLELVLVAGETIPLIVTGNLKEEYDGRYIIGQDCVWVLLFEDVGVTEIISPASGTVQTFTPEVTVENFGTKKAKNVPVNMVITQTAKFLEEDFEANDGGYTVTGDVWEWGTPLHGPSAAHSGSYCWGTNLDDCYPNNANAKLDSSPITLPIGATLKFWHWYSIETSWDGCNVKISTDGGTSWTVITPIGGYIGTANSANPLYPEPIFTGTGQQYWEEETFDLAAYEGMTVKLRFDFGSDGSVYYPGYFIDDVSIYETVEITDYDETVYIASIDAGEIMNVVFPDWTPPPDSAVYHISACTQLATDEDTSNDCMSEDITLT